MGFLVRRIERHSQNDRGISVWEVLESKVTQKEEQRPSIPIDTANETTFSACLICMDDNHFLAEWLAYHYFTLRLTHVVLAPDPQSKTSPEFIIERWKDRMKIELWNTTMYYIDKGIRHGVKRHDDRQAQFNMACLRHLKSLNRTWTLMTDLDEYTHVSASIHKKSSKLFDPTVKVSSIEESGSVIDFLDQLRERVETRCIKIQRRQFAPIESLDDISLPSGVTTLHTLKWNRYNYNYSKAIEWNEKWNKRWGCGIPFEFPPKPDAWKRSEPFVYPLKPYGLLGKAVVDLSRVNATILESNGKGMGNPHYPLGRALCRTPKVESEDNVYLIGNHYTGTLEQWMYRSHEARGDRRLQKISDLKDWYGVDEDTSIQPWLGAFRRWVGEEESRKLLHGAGELHPFEGHYNLPVRKIKGKHFQSGEKVFVCDNHTQREAVVVASAVEHEQYHVLYLDECTKGWPVDESVITYSNASGTCK